MGEWYEFITKYCMFTSDWLFHSSPIYCYCCYLLNLLKKQCQASRYEFFPTIITLDWLPRFWRADCAPLRLWCHELFRSVSIKLEHDGSEAQGEKQKLSGTGTALIAKFCFDDEFAAVCGAKMKTRTKKHIH